MLINDLKLQFDTFNLILFDLDYHIGYVHGYKPVNILQVSGELLL